MQSVPSEYEQWSQPQLVQRVLELEARQREWDAHRAEQALMMRLTEALRWHEGQTLATWADAVLSEFVPALGALGGALYTYQVAGRQLTRVGGYALPPNAPAFISQDEGLAGQAMTDGRAVRVQADVLAPLGAGMAQVDPSAGWFQPLWANDRLIGLLELTANRDFTAQAQHLIPQLADRLAVQLSVLAYQERMQTLFDEAQQRSNQLNAQEEELRQNLEELAATQEEMQRVQLALQAHDAQLSSILNGSQDIILVLDRNFNILYCNEVARERYARVDIHLREGLHFPSVLPSQDAEARLQRYQRVLAGEAFVLEMATQAFGDDSFVRASYSPLTDAHGAVQGITMYIVDLTARHQAETSLQQAKHTLEAQEEELRQNLEELQATQDELTLRATATEELSRMLDQLIDQLPVACYVKEAAELRFVRYNRMAETMFGFAQSSILGKNMYDLYPQAEADAFARRDREVLASDTQLTTTDDLVTADGTRRRIRTTRLALRAASGQATHLLVLAEDLNRQTS